MRRFVLKSSYLVLVWLCGALANMHALADVVTLKDGRQVSGLIESGNTQEVRIQTEGRTEAIEVEQIQSIRFGPPEAAAPQPQTSSPAPSPTSARPQPSSAPSAAPQPAPAPTVTPQPAPAPTTSAPTPSHGITLPAGTEIAVRTIERIDSKKADRAHEYAGSLDDPIVVNGVEVVPANAGAILKVVEA